MAKRIRSLDPIIDKNSRVLILGTMPGPESLRRRQYYANPRNQFWKIIYLVQGMSEDPPADYSEKIDFLRENGVALWDVMESCEREGASDSRIRRETPNDFKRLMRRSPNLRQIFFNGKKAEQCFKKHGCAGGIKSSGLPSTSPANRKQTLDEKIRCWSVIKYFL